MTTDELIKVITILKEDNLSLRTNEIFMKRVTDQVKAIRSTMSLCNFQSFYSNYRPTVRNGPEYSSDFHVSKVLKVLEELMD